MSKKKRNNMRWVKMDLHLHTPVSDEYMDPDATYLDVLKAAEEKELEIIGFTDHNTVAGYRAMQEEIEGLEFLERLNRLEGKEKHRLDEYRRLLKRVLVLPGFEFTATLGFHVLGLFSPDTDVREIEFILLELNVPPEKLDKGSSEVGATNDVLTAYRLIDEAGGIVIAAHVNSSHGVAMRRMGFGGQTRIAYTQDPHLHALEVTDLEKKGRHTTMRFFDGSRPEYPRRMRCIQNSDAHRLRSEPDDKDLGVGDRVTEVLLPEVSFDALRDVLTHNDFARTRPYRPTKQPVDFIQTAREEGATIIQDFHAGYTRRGGRLYAILADICGFANTNGGTLYVGASANPKEQPTGVNDPSQVTDRIKSEVERRITPPLNISIDTQESQGKKLLRIGVPRGDDPPYAIDDSKIYVRSETETGLAVRDEIVSLVTRSMSKQEEIPSETKPSDSVEPPRTGVEVVESENRNGTIYHVLRDLRNGNVVKNVTRKSARRLWHYAITQVEDSPIDPKKVDWQGPLGVAKERTHRGRTRYDLVQRVDDKIRQYFGVTESGIHDEWTELVGLEEE